MFYVCSFEALADELVYDAADLRARLDVDHEGAWCLQGLAACRLPDAGYRELLAGGAAHPDEAVRTLVAREAIRLDLLCSSAEYL